MPWYAPESFWDEFAWVLQWCVGCLLNVINSSLRGCCFELTVVHRVASKRVLLPISHSLYAKSNNKDWDPCQQSFTTMNSHHKYWQFGQCEISPITSMALSGRGARLLFMIRTGLRVMKTQAACKCRGTEHESKEERFEEAWQKIYIFSARRVMPTHPWAHMDRYKIQSFTCMISLHQRWTIEILFTYNF